MKIELKDYVYISDYAKMKGISSNWVHQLIKQGNLRYIEHCNRKLIYIGNKNKGRTFSK